MSDRRLAAILAADIAGYSALMGADDVGTVSALKGHQAVVLPLVQAFGGRVVDTAGDGILGEFPSVLNAVSCAVAIQDAMRERNASIAPDRRMQYRIGINQGDVLFDDHRIYGNGVNVAARLEAMCEPGGICITGKVLDEIRGRVDVYAEYVGRRRLKNIVDPVRVYCIRSAGVRPGRREIESGAWSLRAVWTTAALIAVLGASSAWSSLVSGGSSEAQLSSAIGRSALAASVDENAGPRGPHPYDGIWELVLSGGRHCPVKTRTFRLVAQGGMIVSSHGHSVGTVSRDGIVRFSGPTPVNPKVMVDFQGRLVGDVGSGTYRASAGLCEGTYRSALVERL